MVLFGSSAEQAGQLAPTNCNSNKVAGTHARADKLPRKSNAYYRKFEMLPGKSRHAFSNYNVVPCNENGYREVPTHYKSWIRA